MKKQTKSATKYSTKTREILEAREADRKKLREQLDELTLQTVNKAVAEMYKRPFRVPTGPFRIPISYQKRPLVQVLTGNSHENLYLNGELINSAPTLHAIDVLELLQDHGIIELKVFELETSFDGPVPGTFDKAQNRGAVGDEIEP